MDEQIYSVAEAAERLRVTEPTVRNWISSGILGHSRVGGRILVTETDIKEALSRRRVEPDPAT